MLVCTGCGISFEAENRFCTNCGRALTKHDLENRDTSDEQTNGTSTIIVFLQKNGQQFGPYELSAIKGWIQKGQCSPYDLAWYDGLSEWQPLDILFPDQETPKSWELEREMELLEVYSDEIKQLIESFVEADDDRTSKYLENQLLQRMSIYERQVGLIRNTFGESGSLKFYEVLSYSHRAVLRFNARGFLRTMSGSSNSWSIGIAAGMMAKQQERNNALEAVQLLDQSISIFDTPEARMLKVEILHAIGHDNYALPA